MKAICLILLNLLLSWNLNARDHSLDSLKATKIEGFDHLYQYENFYLSGQPDTELLTFLKEQGVSKIVNLRTEAELKNLDFCEKTQAEEMGFTYISFPVDGSSYTPDRLDAFNLLLDQQEKVLIHCRSAGRATYFLMAHLITGRDYTVDEAVAVGKTIRFSFPLEDLLGCPITMEIKK